MVLFWCHLLLNSREGFTINNYFLEFINHFLGGVSKLKSNNSKETFKGMCLSPVLYKSQLHKSSQVRNFEEYRVSRTELKGEEKRMAENKD